MNPVLAAPGTAEFASLLSARGETLVAFEQISEKGCGGAHLATYCLKLASGRKLKARRYANREVMQRNLDLRACFHLPGYPAPLAHAGPVLLEPWIEGEPLTAYAPSPAQMYAAGALLSELHAQPSPPQFGDRLAGVQARLSRLEERLQEFALSEQLTPAETASLFELARTTAPRRHESGLGHRDFRPENLLWNETGLVCIDNDTFDFGPYDEDLARVWLLWPMHDAAREAFWQGYAIHRDPASFLNHFAFWAIYSAVNCVLFRQDDQNRGWEVPLARLRELAKLDPADPAARTHT